MSRWRLLDSDLVDGPTSAALDEAILEARAADLVPNTLHFYRRKPPAVSIGYFQLVNEVVDMEFCREHGIDIVRRISGGGAIYTDERCLEYAVAVNVGYPGISDDVQKTFETICRGLVYALEWLGVEASYKPTNDVLAGGRKISGNAQARRKGVILQHGTLLVDADFEAMYATLKAVREAGVRLEERLTTVKAELEREVSVEEAKEALRYGFAKALGMELYEGELTGWEKARVRELVNKHKSVAWVFRR